MGLAFFSIFRQFTSPTDTLNNNNNNNLKSRRGESNFISAIRGIIDADMATQQRVHGIFKDFYVIQNRFSCSAHQ